MLHLLYLLVFSGLAILAIGSMVRSLMVLGTESQRHSSVMPPRPNRPASNASPTSPTEGKGNITLHPEMLDESGHPIREPLLVMKSITVDDARDRLDAIFHDSPENSEQDSE